MRKYIVLLFGIVLLGCNSEEDITPVRGNELLYKFPQGNNAYDDKIFDYYEKYGFYILYDFLERDLYWSNTQWDEAYVGTDKYTTGCQGILLGEKADPQYVEEALDMYENLFFNHYPDNLLKQLPKKFLLCSELKNLANGHTINDDEGHLVTDENGVPITIYDTVQIHMHTGFNRFAVNWASEKIDTLSTEMKVNFQRAINGLFLNYLYKTKGCIEICEEFTQVSSYSGSSVTGDAAFAQGYVTGTTVVYGDVEQSKKNDFEAYLQLITIPLS